MIKNIITMSAMQAVQYVFFNRMGVENFAIISIQEYETNGNGYIFTKTGCCKDVLTLNFSDADPKVFEKYNETHILNELLEEDQCKLFSQEDAKAIKEFVDKINQNEEITELIIHCSLGVSRSPAVAAAIHKYLFGNTGEFFEKQLPNIYVYEKLMNVLRGE